MLELRCPRPGDEAAFLAARAAVPADNPTFLRDYREGMAYADFLRLLDDYRAGHGLQAHVAPSTFLFAFAPDGRIVGRASLRHALVPPHGEAAGHVGVSVLPAFRNRGHATWILQAAARLARDELGLARVLVTCDDDNLASKRAIEKAGGDYLDTWQDATLRRPKLRYWVAAPAEHA